MKVLLDLGHKCEIAYIKLLAACYTFSTTTVQTRIWPKSYILTFIFIFYVK